LRPNDKNPEDPLIKEIANVVQILNGKDSAGKVIHLGPQLPKIPRYLLVLFVAKSRQMFRLGHGKEIDGSIYFSLYGLGKVANFLRLDFERTKVASRIYTMLSNNGIVAIRKIDGDTYITITEKGDDISSELLHELIAYGEIDNMPRIAKFRALGNDPGWQKAQKRLAEKISEINLPFEDELKTEDDAEALRRLDDRRHK
jgi:hypothetical protein